MANNFLRIKTLFDILFQKVKTLTTLVDNSITKISTEFSVGDYSTTVPVQYWRRTTYDISYANWTSYTTYNKNSYVNIAGNTENSFVCLYDNCVGENPDNCWGTRTVSSLPSGKYVWSRMATYYANYKTPIYSDAICITSYDNGEVTSTSFSYGVTNSLAIDNPETEVDWQTDIPAVNDGQYLWIRTIIDYTDESVPDTVSYMYQRKGSGASSSISAYTSVDSQSIECSLDGKVLNDTTITIPFGAYSGTTRIACTASVSGITASSGLSYITESSTSSSEGNVVITIPKGSTLDEQSVFNLTIDISVSGLPFSKNLCITKAVNGKEINSIKSVTYYYITTVTENKPDINADWKSEDNKPVVTPVNKYLWQKEVMVFTSSSTQTRINLLAVYGDAGATGTAGDSVSVYSIMYQIGTSATEPPTETWSTSIVEPTNANQYLWTRNVMFKTSGYWKATAYTTDGTTTWSATKSYVAGDTVVVNGITEYSYSCVVANTNKVPAVKYTAYSIAKKGEQGLQGDKGEDGYTPIKGVDYFDGKSAYEIAVDKGYSGTELEWLKSLEGIDGTNGKDGTRGSAVYVASVDFASGSYTLGSYRINVNNLTPLISGVVVSAGDVAYYSTSTVSKYYPITTVETIGSTTYAYADTFLDVRGKDGINGTNGKDGTSAYTHIKYSANSDGTDFVASPTTATKYIGVYSGTSSTAPTSKSNYTWSKFVGDNGANGKAGNGINSITYYYAVTTTQTAPSASTITSSSIPTLSATNKYLWQKEVIDFTDTSVADQTTVILLAVYGDSGKDGTNGKDGTSVTIKSTAVTYQASSSGTTTPTGTWSTSVPTVANGNYLWTKTYVEYSDNTSTISYSVAYKGTNGTNGKDGTSAYLHYAYSTSSDGKENFSTTPFAGAIYLGLCTDDNEADPTTYTSYSWSKIKGDDGKDGNIYSNLVINGFGENDTLAPWTSGAYVSGDSPQGCKGYFKSNARSDYIDYDPNIKYELSYWSRLDPSLTDASTDYYDYFAVIPHDVDKLLIACYMTPSFNSSVFKLAKDFNYGDEYMYFEDLSNWNTTRDYGWYIAIYDYEDGCGYKYPTGTYTRNVLCFYKNAKVDVANKRIYVKDALYYCQPKTTIPAGTEVMQHYDRSTYPYYGQQGKITNTEWFHWVNLIVDAYADPMYFASGLRVARYIRVGFADYKANLAGVMLKPISEAADDTLTDIQYRYCATSGNIPNISTSTWYISISDALNKGSGSKVYAYLTFSYRNGTTSRMREPVLVYNGSNSIAATDWYFAIGTDISCPSSISNFPTGWPYSTWFTFSRGIASKLKLSEQYPGLFAYCKVTTKAGTTTAYGPYLVKTTAPQIQKMVRQYYLSTSKTDTTGSVWSDAAPTSIPKDTYVWTRLALLYDSGWEYTKEQHMADVTYITSKLYEVDNTLTETCITKSEFNTGLAQKVSTSTYNNKTNQIDQRLSSLEQTANTVNLHFGANGDYTKHFSFSSSGLEIKGGTSSDIRCVIDNDSFAFVDKSNVEQLTLTTNGAELHSAKIDTTLQLGNESTNTTDWRIRETANKNLIIDWIGG